jgi:superfamily II DNA or RNA helicase
VSVARILSGLREWQAEALSLWLERGCSGIVEVATGGGKTRLALACASQWMTEPTDRCLILVPTVALQDQWVVSLEEDLGVPRDRIQSWGDDPESGNSRPFHVMVINTARTMAAEVAALPGRLLLVADECHRYGSPSNARALEIATSATLGLTATAQREWDDGLENILQPALGDLFYRYSLTDASSDGVISDFRLTNIRVPLSGAEQAEIDRLSRSIGRAFSEGNDERAKLLSIRRAGVSKRALSRTAAAVLLVERHAGERILVFHEDIESAESIATILRSRGTPALTYHSKVAVQFRRDNLRLFRRGEAPVLVCCRALDEGIDVPEVNVAIIAAATSSQRQRVQRLGRALRKAAGKDRAEIATLYATEDEEQRLAREERALEAVAPVSWQRMAPSVEEP